MQKIEEEGDTRAIKKGSSRVSANARFPESDREKGTWRLKAQALMHKPVERKEDKKLNLRLIQRGA